ALDIERPGERVRSFARNLPVLVAPGCVDGSRNHNVPRFHALQDGVRVIERVVELLGRNRVGFGKAGRREKEKSDRNETSSHGFTSSNKSTSSLTLRQKLPDGGSQRERSGDHLSVGR